MKTKYFSKAILVSAIAFSVSAFAHRESPEDKLVAEFCDNVGVDMQIYKVETGQYYTTGLDDDHGHNSYGSGSTVDEIIKAEHGTLEKCKKKL